MDHADFRDKRTISRINGRIYAVCGVSPTAQRMKKSRGRAPQSLRAQGA
jgi:hypothetical protein